MKLRFKINQSEAFRRGIDAPESIGVISVDPKTLNGRVQIKKGGAIYVITERDFIADHLDGIDVCKIEFIDGEWRKKKTATGRNDLVEVFEPTLKGLMDALRILRMNSGA